MALGKMGEVEMMEVPRVVWGQMVITGWVGNSNFFCWKFHPANGGKMIQFDEYFSDGLKPPTRLGLCRG